MSKVLNMVGGGGKNISSIVITGLASTDIVTCTKDEKSYTAAWDATSQHWEIVGLPLGTFTVTATNGTKTITETVLIDVSGVYEIEMAFELWLYRDGDECEAITGGWIGTPFKADANEAESSFTMEKQDSCLYLASPYRDSLSYQCALQTTKPIDVTNFTKICVLMSWQGNDTKTVYKSFPVYGAETKSSQGNGFKYPIGYNDSTYYPEDNSESVGSRTNKLYEFPITGSAKNLYITLAQWALITTLKKWVYRVWLE